MSGSESESRRVALTVAGSDSGGGAGIQADLRTFHAFGVFGTSALTAVTAQNTRGVRAVRILEPDLILAQIAAVCEDLAPAAAKTGMLGDEGGVLATAGGLREAGLERIVVDPVMVATSGDRLLDPDARDALRRHLLPLATVVTPNLAEAGILTGKEVRSLEEMSAAARTLVDAGARATLVKGGHGGGDEIVDLLWDGGSERIWRGPRLRTTSTHGTGCTLSAAIAAGLALGRELEEAVDEGIRYTRAAIAAAPGLGRGHGPLNHWVDAPDPT